MTACPPTALRATPSNGPTRRSTRRGASLLLAIAVLGSGCTVVSRLTPAAPAAEGSAPKARLHAVTDQAELISLDASAPGRILQRRPLSGLPAGERLVGIDYRVARGVLYALSSGGRLYTLDVTSGRLQAAGSAAALRLPPGAIGFDFNPAADRIRVVGADGGNWRLHPDTGALVATDPPLHYGLGDAAWGQAPRLAGAGYTYNEKDDKLTTNYAIDRARGTLVTQGTVEGTTPAVSPNTGRLYTVGPLGTGPVDDAHFDIADTDNTALAALRRGARTHLHRIDLRTGAARDLGPIGEGRALWGLAIEP